MQRVFVDANVLFSAAYNTKRQIANLWNLTDIEIVTSAYAAAEALRNLRRKYPGQVADLRALLSRTRLVPSASAIPAGIGGQLHEKDHPILAAAIASRAGYLLTGDEDFAPLFGRVIEGVLIIRPGDYLRLRAAD